MQQQTILRRECGCRLMRFNGEDEIERGSFNLIERKLKNVNSTFDSSVVSEREDGARFLLLISAALRQIAEAITLRLPSVLGIHRRKTAVRLLLEKQPQRFV
ncbi:hypothetical protein CDAR_492741 [Caerostris darwini]|uniref:Uncharacterized protein n=1 Tax=Caerostris darwini TaxID=1538125 RepID=A0AAV4UZB3_9ARAC|nr:hypothetical protein CDAR_492741 [Caerostris darwini]